MAYNFLKDALIIRNSTLCVHDTSDGFKADFTRNGDVDDWEIYYNVYLYGCWDTVLFGTATDNFCFIQRAHNFLSIEAEEYYILELVMKITPDPDRPYLPTKGKVMWLRTDDNSWTEDKASYFDLKLEPNWQRYSINLGPERWWQGNINNLRVFPFIDGHSKCKFAFKEIRITSINAFSCKQTSCDYYTFYEHPCPGAGKRATIVSAKSKLNYTTVSGISDSLYINIDDYGDYKIELGTNIDLNINLMCRLLEQKISTLSIGGYNFVEVTPTIDNKIEIKSGLVGKSSSVIIAGGTSAQELFFLDENNTPIYTTYEGKNSASHYDYASPVKLSHNVIARLLGDQKTIVYNHKPKEYSVEAGNKDFFHSISSNRENKFSVLSYIINLANTGSTVLDLSHPVTNNGVLTDFYISCGKVIENSRIYVLRPHMDGSFTVVDYVELNTEEEGLLYTVFHTTHHVKKNIHVSKGDILAIYNANVAVSVSESKKNVDACYFKVVGKPKSRFYPEVPKGTGTMGFHIFARGNRVQDSIMLDIDFGYRVNSNVFKIKGEEYVDTFEYNIAICKDLNWKVDCRGETHHHELHYCTLGGAVTYTHTNIPYGIKCLNDAILSPDGGKQGTYFSQGSDGIVTGGEHSYFYINGDGEWDFGSHAGPAPLYEFYSGAPWCSHKNYDYIYDSIHFILDITKGFSVDIHKTKMYFKEGKNFRHFSLQYFIGQELSQETGKSVGYRYIKKYNSILIDSVEYTPDSFGEGEVSKDVASYLFVNPTAWVEPIYSGKTCINWNIVQTARDLTWNVLEHRFDPISCQGYRFIVDHHVSTKMTEFEVYSSFPVEPGLVDNALLSASVDGKYWQRITFDYTDEINIIEAKINMAPRFLRIHLYSQDIFSLYGMYMNVTDAIIMQDCKEEFLLPFIQNPNYSEIIDMDFKNIYASVADFNVSLPINYNEQKIKIADVNLISSNNNVLIHKNKDFPIYLAFSHIANNCKAYGLKNLIDGKKSYLLSNSVYKWDFFKEMKHGESLSLITGNTGTTWFVSFNDVSIRYLFLTVSTSFLNIYTLAINFKGKLLNIFCNSGVVLKEDAVGLYVENSGYLHEVGNDGSVKRRLIFDGSFSNYLDYSVWKVISKEYVFGNSLEVFNDEIYPKTLVKESYVGIKTTFKELISFDFETVFKFNCSTFYPLYLRYNFLKGKKKLFVCSAERSGNNSYVFVFYDGENNIIFSSNLSNSTSYSNKIIIYKTGSDLHFKLQSLNGILYKEIILTDFLEEGIDTIECVFESATSTVIIDKYINWGVEYIHLYSVVKVTVLDCVAIDLGEVITIDRLIFKTLENSLNLNLFYSNSIDGILYSLDILYLTSHIVDNYLAIDLENFYTLDIIRNYGDMTNKLFLSLDSFLLQYATTDVSDINDVDWGINKDTCLLVFNDVNKSTNFIDVFNEDRIFYKAGAYISTQTFYTGGSSCYFNSNSLLGMVDSESFNFKDLDFGILFFIYLKSNIYEDKVLLSKWGNSIEHRSYYIGINKDKCLYLKYTTDGVKITTLNFDTSLPIGKWVAVEISRASGYLYMFLDGVLDVVHAIPFSFFQDTYYNVYLGGILGNIATYFYGYIDNLHIRCGSHINTVSYDVLKYLSTLNIKAYNEYRWIKITLPTSYENTIDKLGVYPDITFAINKKGTYNCSWEPLGNLLTDYFNTAYNVAPTKYRITATSTVYDCTVDKIVNGINTAYGFQDCWGFDISDEVPTVVITLDDYHKVNKIKLYHGVEEGDGYETNDFIIKGYPVASGIENVELVSVVDNHNYETVHMFDPIIIQKIELQILKYTSGNLEINIKDETENGRMVVLDGGFLREIEIYTYYEDKLISSEDYPIVCFDLGYQFKITNFYFEEVRSAFKDITWLSYTTNKSNFSFYSDTLLENPKKVSFFKSKDQAIYFMYLNKVSTNTMVSPRFILSEAQYFDKGAYIITWKTYNSLNDATFCLEFSGPGGIDEIFPENTAENAWSAQYSGLIIDVSGLYTISFLIKILDDVDKERIIKDIVVRKSIDNVRWFCIKDDTATDYAFDNQYTSKGQHYLKKVRVYGDRNYSITEYPRWWATAISKLSYNYIAVKEGNRSLQINYTSSTVIDYICYREADSFKKDSVWLEKDFLTFWWFISDINNFDIEYGAIGFGNPNNASPSSRPEEKSSGRRYAYGWDIIDLNLKSGWNEVKLQFSKYNSIDPVSPDRYYKEKQAPVTNLRHQYMIGFIIYYRGTGKGHLIMYIDGLKIKRCWYEELVNNKPALCLSYDEFAEISLSNLTIEKGTISAWIKMYNDTAGVDLFGGMVSRTLFTIISSDNDIILFGIRQGSWFEFGVGDAFKKYTVFALKDNDTPPADTYVDYDETFHVTLMWDNLGGMSNGDSFRLYLNGELIWYSQERWKVDSYNTTKIVLGGGSPATSLKNRADGAAIFGNVKIYNYCLEKSDYMEVESSAILKTDPNDYVYVSLDGINFYDRYSSKMPLTASGVLMGEKVKVYVKSIKTAEFKKIKDKSADLLVDWVVAV